VHSAATMHHQQSHIHLQQRSTPCVPAQRHARVCARCAHPTRHQQARRVLVVPHSSAEELVRPSATAAAAAASGTAVDQVRAWGGVGALQCVVWAARTGHTP
jgi:hypothetical protein